MKIYFVLLVLVFCSVISFSQENVLRTGFYKVIDNDSCSGSGDFLKISDGDEKYCIDKNPIVTKDHFSSVKISPDTSSEGIFNTVRIKLDSSSVEEFKEATEKLVGKRLAFIINNKIIAAPVLRDPIQSGNVAVYCDDETINLVKKELHIK